MFNKGQIVYIVKSLNLTEKQYCLIAGAALVMYNIKDETEDIDIVVSEQEFNRINKIYTLTESIKKNMIDYMIYKENQWK